MLYRTLFLGMALCLLAPTGRAASDQTNPSGQGDKHDFLAEQVIKEFNLPIASDKTNTSGKDSTFHAGDTVEAKWKGNDTWYPATIAAD